MNKERAPRTFAIISKEAGFTTKHTHFTIQQVVLSLDKDLIVRKMADLMEITSNTDGSLLVVTFQDIYAHSRGPTGAAMAANLCGKRRFNGLDFLERYRGKKIMLVGDSLSNNMWVSLTCLLHASVPNSSYTIDRKGLLSTFTMQEYGLSVLWLKNGFLIEVAYEKIGKVLKLDSITTGNQWLGMDILIFNSYHWWFHTGRSQTWDYFQVGDKIVKEMDRLEALRIALTTWATWIDRNIDPSKTKVFFQGVAAVHIDPKEWKDPNPSARTCIGQTKPIEGPKYPGPSHPGEAVVRSVISKMARPAYLLDITLLTQLRKDGHPSSYAGKGSALNDCSHWCLAGVPDTWNQLLYAPLLQN
ncbi:unnamed protein product [Dovyalis caffra]|uniref:Trichome birefringence-like C-terminal domain-containing protein n=1 Tax=Dovyalis caffra TaxID=77055 RepID=A0AAV1SM23_9ROSI|nr:unnamed protein product [Dovyalis caffra]